MQDVTRADDLRCQLNHLIYLAGYGLTPVLEKGILYCFRELERTLSDGAAGQTSINGGTEAEKQGTDAGTGSQVLPSE